MEIGLQTKHISAMNKLLKKQHPQQNGLTDTICLSEQSRWNSKTNNFVQVVNVSGNHWVCTANIGCGQSTVNVYCSMPTLSIQSMSLRRQVSVILQTQVRSFELKFINVQRQIGANDCGLFAIANVTSLCLGSDPHLLRYDQSQMRNHLCKCFENNLMTVFPEKGMAPRVNRQRVSATLTIPVYCSCRMAYTSGDSEI